jgi:hypothetical protein
MSFSLADLESGNESFTEAVLAHNLRTSEHALRTAAVNRDIKHAQLDMEYWMTKAHYLCQATDSNRSRRHI